MIKDKPKGKGPCPSWFWGCCKTAAQGGSRGYDSAGYELARHLEELIPHDLDPDDWTSTLESLATFAADGDDGAILEILDTHLPRCMAMVPARRRDSFLAGFHEAIDDGNASF